jgi:tripartite-type tricarboxylate transporter receptor subunit TctC
MKVFIMNLKKHTWATFVLGFILSIFAISSFAQNFPTKPIKIIVPFPPGETGDIMSRLIVPKMSEKLGQAIVIDNRPGASGILGTDLIAKSEPDGYTIGVGQGGNLVTLPHTKLSLPYNAQKDFTPITVSTFNFLAIVASNNTPFKTLPEMIAYAKANPGKLTVGTNGEGGFPHLTFEHLAQAGNFTFTHIPYKGANQVITDLMGGQIMVGIGSIASQITQVNGGLIKMIAVTNGTRVTVNPNFPTVTETIPGWISNGWFGFIGPAGMNPQIVLKLNEAINYALKDPAVRDQLNQAGLIVSTESPQFANDVIKKDYAKYGKLVKDINFKPQ